MFDLRVGNATRFKIQPDQNENLFEQSRTHTADFIGIPGDRTIEYDYAPALAGTSRIEGSDPSLRSLSPFIFRLELPIVCENMNTGEKTSNPGQLYEAGSASGNSFNRSRAQVSNALGGLSSPSRLSSEDYIGANAARFKTEGSSSEPRDVRGLGQTRLAEPSINDLMTAVDIATQLKATLNTPPLILLINPQSVSISYVKMQQYSDRTRRGLVLQAWGEEQPMMNITLQCGAFYAPGRGVQWASRMESAAWNNILSLFQFYKNNGYIFDRLGGSDANHLVGNMSIRYDGWVYYGNMRSMNWSYDESHPNGGISVSLIFAINRQVDVSNDSNVVLPLKQLAADPNAPRYEMTAPPPLRGGGVTVYNVEELSTESSALNPKPFIRR